LGTMYEASRCSAEGNQLLAVKHFFTARAFFYRNLRLEIMKTRVILISSSDLMFSLTIVQFAVIALPTPHVESVRWPRLRTDPGMRRWPDRYRASPAAHVARDRPVVSR